VVAAMSASTLWPPCDCTRRMTGALLLPLPPPAPAADVAADAAAAPSPAGCAGAGAPVAGPAPPADGIASVGIGGPPMTGAGCAPKGVTPIGGGGVAEGARRFRSEPMRGELPLDGGSAAPPSDAVRLPGVGGMLGGALGGRPVAAAPPTVAGVDADEDVDDVLEWVRRRFLVSVTPEAAATASETETAWSDTGKIPPDGRRIPCMAPGPNGSGLGRTGGPRGPAGRLVGPTPNGGRLGDVMYMPLAMVVPIGFRSGGGAPGADGGPGAGEAGARSG